VDIVTASSQTLTNLTGYSLLVLGGPIHGGQPAKAVQDYIAKVSNLNGLRVFTVITSLGGAPQGEQMMSEWIISRGGVETGILSLSTISSNTPVDGESDPFKIAEKVAQKIQK